MNRFMLSKCYEKNSFFISCYFKSKNRSISLGHLIKHKPLFQMSEKISILNMYISTCWKLESSYASEFTEYALSLFWFPLAMYDFSYYCQILIQIQCSLSKLLQKYNQVPCKHSKKNPLLGYKNLIHIEFLSIHNFPKIKIKTHYNKKSR